MKRIALGSVAIGVALGLIVFAWRARWSPEMIMRDGWDAYTMRYIGLAAYEGASVALIAAAVIALGAAGLAILRGPQ